MRNGCCATLALPRSGSPCRRNGGACKKKNRACAGRPQGDRLRRSRRLRRRLRLRRSALRALPGPVEIFVRRVQKFPNITHAAGRTMSVEEKLLQGGARCEPTCREPI